MAAKDSEAKMKHNLLCVQLDGLITADSFESMKRMSRTFLSLKMVGKAKDMNELLQQLEIKGVLGVGKYDRLIELMEKAGIGIGIDDIKKTKKEIQNIMQSNIPNQARVYKTNAKAVYERHQPSVKLSLNKRNSKVKAPVKGTDMKTKSFSLELNTKNSGTSTSSSSSNAKERRRPVNKISSLSKGKSTGWRICARVISKTKIFEKKKKDGSRYKTIEYFIVNFLDKSGQIKAVFFKDTVEKFYKFFQLLKIKKVFYVSGASVDEANQKYPTVHDFELKMNNTTRIVPCKDAVDIPTKVNCRFIKINELQDAQVGEFVDIIGVVHDIGETKTVPTKKKKEEKKRELQMVDKSGMAVTLTLWGKDVDIPHQLDTTHTTILYDYVLQLTITQGLREILALTFRVSGNPVIALYRVKVTDFRGCSLSKLASTEIDTNPKGEEARSLRKWYDDNGRDMTFTYVHC